jgi:hypothetical protein
VLVCHLPCRAAAWSCPVIFVKRSALLSDEINFVGENALFVVQVRWATHAQQVLGE